MALWVEREKYPQFGAHSIQVVTPSCFVSRADHCVDERAPELRASFTQQLDCRDHQLVRSLVQFEQPRFYELEIDLPCRTQSTPPELYYP